jgi:hypothetical protein
MTSVITNATAKVVSVEREYLPVLCEDNDPHTQKGTERRGILLPIKLFQKPCRCCGSPKHSLLSRIPDEEGYMKAIFCCQIIKHQKVSQMNSQSLIPRKAYAPCPIKFTKAHAHQEEAIETALVILYNDGSGKDMSVKEFNAFQTEVLRACFNRRMERSTRKIRETRELNSRNHRDYHQENA